MQQNSSRTTQASTLAHLPTQATGEEAEEGQGRCDNDKEMQQGSGADKRKLHCLALPDQRHQADLQGTSPLGAATH